MSWWTWRDARGTVVERIEGQILDVSTSGCRIEATSAPPVGSVSVIEISGLPTPVVEAARMRHACERPGAAVRHVLHFEFLPLPLPSRASARAVVGTFAGSAPGDLLAGSGERSGCSPTSGGEGERLVDGDGATNRLETEQNSPAGPDRERMNEMAGALKEERQNSRQRMPRRLK